MFIGFVKAFLLVGTQSYLTFNLYGLPLAMGQVPEVQVVRTAIIIILFLFILDYYY